MPESVASKPIAVSCSPWQLSPTLHYMLYQYTFSLNYSILMHFHSFLTILTTGAKLTFWYKIFPNCTCTMYDWPIISFLRAIYTISFISYILDTLQVCREGFDDLCVQVYIYIILPVNSLYNCTIWWLTYSLYSGAESGSFSFHISGILSCHNHWLCKFPRRLSFLVQWYCWLLLQLLIECCWRFIGIHYNSAVCKLRESEK